jgi:WXG100 family type VII secretion target
MSQFRVSPEQIRAVAGQVASGGSEIEQQRTALLGQIQGLGDSWQGTAASALQGLYEKWDSDVRSLMTTLSEIGQAMNQAATQYEETETSVTGMF